MKKLSEDDADLQRQLVDFIKNLEKLPDFPALSVHIDGTNRLPVQHHSAGDIRAGINALAVKGKTGAFDESGDLNRLGVDHWKLLFAVLVEYACELKGPNGAKIFALLSDQLARIELLCPLQLQLSAELAPIRSMYRQAFDNLLNRATDALMLQHQHQPRTGTAAPGRDSALSRSALVSAQRRRHTYTSGETDFFPSRYRQDFEQLSLLGRGGFGHVYKVLCRIDSGLYAVKKVPINASNPTSCFRVLREVRSLARLDHPHIVRYYGAWFEVDTHSDHRRAAAVHNKKPTSVKIVEVDDTSESKASEESATNEHECLSDSLRRTVSCPSVVFEDRSGAAAAVIAPNESEDSDNNVVKGKFLPRSLSTSASSVPQQQNSRNDKLCRGKFWASSGGASVSSSMEHLVTTTTDGGGGPSLAMTAAVNGDALFSTVRQLSTMELCSRSLKQYLHQKNISDTTGKDIFECVDQDFNVEVLRQLLSAVDYIHTKNIVHRDIKPSNIFLRFSGGGDDYGGGEPSEKGGGPFVLLGDFGLACEQHDIESVEAGPSTSALVPRNQSGHSVGVGTYTYSAPEQLNSKHYGSKVDVYSAGIVAFEMYFPFHTYMEKLRYLMELRSGVVPSFFEQRWPQVTAIVREMLQGNSTLRPSAHQLLDHAFFQRVAACSSDSQRTRNRNNNNNSSNNSSNNNNESQQMRAELESLRLQLDAQQSEIERLKRQLRDKNKCLL